MRSRFLAPVIRRAVLRKPEGPEVVRTLHAVSQASRRQRSVREYTRPYLHCRCAATNCERSSFIVNHTEKPANRHNQWHNVLGVTALTA